MSLTVHEVSHELSVSPDTIRRWDKKGLIKSTRNSNNHRVFNLEEVQRLHHKLHSQEAEESLYKVLKAEEKVNISVIELFAGAGGMALGFENAGLKHVLLNEIDKDCVATLKKNFIDIKIIHDNVANLNFQDYENQVDVIQAGFPCQAFSYAGKSMGFEDTRGTLFFEFARSVKEVRPKIAIGENVRGLLNHDGGKTLKTMINTLEDLGYKVKHKILKAQYFDVPQKRERLLIIAIRDDLDIEHIFPQEKNYIISLRDALKDCPKSEGAKYPQKKKEILELVPEGGYWKNLPVELQKEYMKKSFYHTGGRTGMARRLAWSEPSLTLTCSPAQKQTERCHPSETRPLNLREYARIQTFPDSWDFQGAMTSKYKQIGNAVPVNLGYHIAKCIIEMLES